MDAARKNNYPGSFLMQKEKINFSEFTDEYFKKLQRATESTSKQNIEILALELASAWREKKQVFIFGNGGSAGNAIHLANDFIYGVSRKFGDALRIHALSANPSIITCLANDEGYDSVFSMQLAVLANPGDLVIALSGSGNSPNIINALEYCKKEKLKSFAILGYDGGVSINLADFSIHTPINDMQISEDMQLILGHILMQWLNKTKE
jgi:D-sedoheptulose 7-phosphate isomerase